MGLGVEFSNNTIVFVQRLLPTGILDTTRCFIHISTCHMGMMITLVSVMVYLGVGKKNDYSGNSE